MYNKEELEIVDYIEESNPTSVPNLHDKIDKIKSAVSAKYTKRKAINIKVLESDLEKLKSKALEEGMPYQTLLNSVLHKYITGQLVDKSKIA
jgi:predicted DNA binding CopG/RHH family protein